MLKPRRRPAKRVSQAQLEKKAALARMKEAGAAPEPKAVKLKRISQGKLFDLIRNKAYEIYLSRGGVPGNELQDWYAAEEAVKKELGLR